MVQRTFAALIVYEGGPGRVVQKVLSLDTKLCSQTRSLFVAGISQKRYNDIKHMHMVKIIIWPSYMLRYMHL